MGDLGGLTSELTSSSFGRHVKLGVPCLDAACTVDLNQLSVASNPDKPTQNRLKNKPRKTITVFITEQSFLILGTRAQEKFSIIRKNFTPYVECRENLFIPPSFSKMVWCSIQNFFEYKMHNGHTTSCPRRFSHRSSDSSFPGVC